MASGLPEEPPSPLLLVLLLRMLRPMLRLLRLLHLLVVVVLLLLWLLLLLLLAMVVAVVVAVELRLLRAVRALPPLAVLGAQRLHALLWVVESWSRLVQVCEKSRFAACPHAMKRPAAGERVCGVPRKFGGRQAPARHWPSTFSHLGVFSFAETPGLQERSLQVCVRSDWHQPARRPKRRR